MSYSIIRALSRGRATSALASTLARKTTVSSRMSTAAEAEKVEVPDNSVTEKAYPRKIVDIVDQISTLNLLEVSDLNALLKSRLNISDAPVMMAGGGAMAAPAAAAEEEEEEEEAPAAVQTSFTLKLKAFDPPKKVALIKELKNQLEGMNLVQAKKFVESAPAIVKSDMSKTEVEDMKKALEAAGGDLEIE